MRIGALSDPNLVNSNYRVFHPLAAVARRGGHEVVRNVAGQRMALEQLLRCHVVHIHRIANDEVYAIVRRLRAAGVGVVWDNDDDVGALPRSNPYYARLGAAGRRAMVADTAKLVRLADIVTTPSLVLADKYREIGATDVRVIENHLPPEFSGGKPIAHDGVVIACLAGLEHRIDYERTGLYETLRRILDAHPDVRLLTIGLGLGLPRTEHIPLVAFLQLVRTLARADVGIAPLVDIPWNRARSNVKLKEYAAAGLAWLASPVGPYIGMGERQGGRLVADDGWDDALERLINDKRARRKLAKQGEKWIKDEVIDAHAAAWEAVLRDAAAAGTQRRAAA